MATGNFAKCFRPLALAGLILLGIVSAAHAAGEWEWTSGQGWVRGAGVARPTPKEQLHYAYELEKRGEYMDSARQYFLLVQNFPSSQEAGIGLQRLARCLFEMENYYTSYKAIEQVIETYPNTGRMSDLVEIELRIAKKLMVSQTPDLLSDRESNIREFNIRRALEIVDSVIEHDPYGPVAAEAYLVKGEGHLFINEIAAARKSFETIRDEFPRSDYIERARYGILTCDSLMGQATPRELQEQAEVVREFERERAERSRGELEEIDSVEDTIRNLNSVEAAKMMEQAEVYRRMGTKQSVESSEFLYKEIARRYPGTNEAEDAMSKLNNLKIPKERGRIAKVVKGINLNPFTYNKDPEPPWIVPQMDPEDMVMVDAAMGPIVGVPETGEQPTTDFAVGVRPQNLREQQTRARSGNFSPLSAAPRAPDFIDASAPAPRQRVASNNGLGDFGVGRQTSAPRNPLNSASEADLVLPPGSVPPGSAAGQSGYVAQTPPPAPIYAAPGQPASLGPASYHTPYSDLVGPMPTRYGDQAYAGGGTYQAVPVQEYNPQYQGQQQQYPPQSYPLPSPVQGGSGFSGTNGGWTLTEDFR